MPEVEKLIMQDIEKAIAECMTPDYYGNLTVRVNIQGGAIRNVNYAPERSKMYG